MLKYLFVPSQLASSATFRPRLPGSRQFQTQFAENEKTENILGVSKPADLFWGTLHSNPGVSLIKKFIRRGTTVFCLLPQQTALFSKLSIVQHGLRRRIIHCRA